MTLAQLSRCTGVVCSLADDAAFDPQLLPITIPGVVDVAPAGDDAYVTVSQETQDPHVSVITSVRGGEERRLAASPAEMHSRGEGLAGSGTRWWYTRHLRSGRRSKVLFVIGDGAGASVKVVEDLRERPLLWLPIQGDLPGGLLLSVSEDGESMYVDEVTPAGVVARGSIAWNTALPFRAPSMREWSAVRLPDGRIAMLSIEQPGGSPATVFMLRVIAPDGITENSLTCDAADALASASYGNGIVGMVALSPARTIIAAEIDVDHPAAARCLAWPEKAQGVSIHGGDGRPVAAWVADDGAVRASELRTPSLVFDIAHGADRARPVRLSIDAGAEHVSFIWKDEHGGWLSRRVPQPVTGYAFAAAVLRRLCDGMRFGWRELTSPTLRSSIWSDLKQGTNSTCRRRGTPATYFAAVSATSRSAT